MYNDYKEGIRAIVGGLTSIFNDIKSEYSEDRGHYYNHKVDLLRRSPAVFAHDIQAAAIISKLEDIRLVLVEIKDKLNPTPHEN